MRRHKDIEALLDAWLRAEQGADDGGAEEALQALMMELPSPSPSPGFADRVLLAAGFRRPLGARPWRWALAAVLLLVPATLLAAVSLRLLPVVGRWLGPADVVAGITRLGVAAFGWIGTVASLWGRLAELGHFARLLAGAPQAQMALACCAGLAAAGYGVLHLLLNAPTRSARHAYLD